MGDYVREEHERPKSPPVQWDRPVRHEDTRTRTRIHAKADLPMSQAHSTAPVTSLADHIDAKVAEVVAAAPPLSVLSVEKCDRLAALLRTGQTARAA